MQCDRIGDEGLAAEKMELLYGEADAQVRDRVDAHLQQCAACREEMAALRRLRRDLGAWTLQAPRGSKVSSPPRRLRAGLLTAAAALVALGLGLALEGQASLRREIARQEARAHERERQHREEVAALREALARGPHGLDAEAVLARVDERLESRLRASQARQAGRLEASLADWAARMEAQRRVDLARVAAGLSYLDGRNGQQLARTNELMGYVLETAGDRR